MNIAYMMIRCLSWTIIIELLCALILKVNDKKDLINIILANIITNPLVVTIPIYFNIRYGVLARNTMLITLELLTVLIEGLIYKKYLKYKKINLFLLSLILNGASYLIGELLNHFL